MPKTRPAAALVDPRVWWSHAEVTVASGLRVGLEQPEDAVCYAHHARHARSDALAARALLRALIQARWGAWWSRAGLAHEPRGAPFLLDGPAFAISLSHSGDQVAVAACTARSIGIDIERIDPYFKMATVVQRCFHAREIQALEQMASHHQQSAFFAWWVAKEAVIKCLHQGLYLPPASFIVPNPQGAGPVLGLETPVWVTALSAPAGYRAALAWVGGAHDLQEAVRWDLPDH